MRLIVFLHGTVLMHRAAAGRKRAERVAQVVAGDPATGRTTSPTPRSPYPQIPPEARERITPIVVPESDGIDHLPDDPDELLNWRP